MSDVNISKYRAQVIRQGSTPASPGFAVAEGQNPVDPSGSGQTHLPVTIATASTGLSITESQILSGAGLVSQYIRGDGSLADFPESSGGGSSVSYYLNGSVSQGTIGGVAYKQLNRTPVFGAGTDITISADGYIASFITDASDPNKLLIPAGNWNFETYFSASSSGGSPSFYVELYKYDGTTFTLIATSSSAPELIAFGTSLNPYFSTLAVPQTTLALTDRLALRYYVTHSGRTITLHTENNHLCEVITTFTTGLTALNGLTAQVQNFAVGTSGTDFAISSATATHTFNLPTASATNRGALSSADWTTFNNKTSNVGTVTSVGLSSATSGVTIGSSPVTTSGTITLAIATASGSQNGLLSSTDWTTFNSKQNALTNPVTGTGTTNYLPKFTGTSTIGDSNIINHSGGNVGIGTALNTTGFSRLVLNGGNGNESGIQVNYNASTFGGFALTTLQAAGGGMAVYTYTGNVGSESYAEAMRIFSGRNVHIGPTPVSDNGARLQVSGTATISGIVGINGLTEAGWGLKVNQNLKVENNNGTTVLQVADTASGGKTWSLISSGSGNVHSVPAGTFYLRNSSDSLTALSVTSSGNVGIGTGSPSNTLTIKNNNPATSGIDFQSFASLSVQGKIVFDQGDDTFNFTNTSAFAAGGIVFKTNSTTKFQIFTDGNVLIQSGGTFTNNGARLQVSGTAMISSNVTLTSGFLSVDGFGNKDTNYITLRSGFSPSDSGGLGLKAIDHSGSSTDGLACYGHDGISLYTAQIERMRISSGGDIGIGADSNSLVRLLTRGKDSGTTNYAFIAQNSSTTNLFLIRNDGAASFFSLGTGTVTATAGTLSTVSDSSYKIDDGFIDSAIEKVLNLKPRYFYWNEKSGLPKHIRQLGFYAQEVNKALGEEAANTPQDKNTPWGISDRSMIAYLTKAIQELKQEIDTLKN